MADRYWLWFGVVITGVASAIAGRLADDIAGDRGLALRDPAVTQWAVDHRSEALTFAAKTLSLAGGPVGLSITAAVVLWWVVWRRRELYLGMLIAATMGASLLITVVMKDVIGRPRPPSDLMLGPVLTSFAFPSGHSLNSVVFFGLAALVTSTAVRGVARRVFVLSLWLLAGLGVGLSRIYLGYHWMTDVMAGWSIGFAILGAGLAGLSLIELAPRRLDLDEAELGELRQAS